MIGKCEHCKKEVEFIIIDGNYYCPICDIPRDDVKI
jgi:DNA-directed RNA polymerase subunit RPC12/RpoP